MTGSAVESGVEGRTGWIALNRPSQRNAINRQAMAEIGAALALFAKSDEVAAVVIYGRGPSFCAGMDLKDDATAGTSGTEGWRRVLTENLDFVMQFWDHPKTTIAAVHGHCLAAGADLALACDITVADEGATFGKPELQFGSTITAMLMPFMIGPKIAKEIILTGEDKISAARAHAIGLVNRVVAPGESLDEAMRIAERIARLDDDAVRLSKRAMNAALDSAGLREALAANLDLAVEIETLETPSRREFSDLIRREGLTRALAWRAGRMSS